MDITVDPQNRDTVYVVAGCVLFKSTDGGTNWTRITSRVANCLTYARVEIDNGNTLSMRLQGDSLGAQMEERTGVGKATFKVQSPVCQSITIRTENTPL
jgi:hypothetical protein